MNNTVICGDCGFIGQDSELLSSKMDLTNVQSFVREIVIKNGMTRRSCPSCSSTNLFFKRAQELAFVPSVFPYQSNLNKQVISDNLELEAKSCPVDISEKNEEEVDADLISGVLESAEEEYDIESEDEMIKELREEIKKDAKKELKESKKRRGRPAKAKKPVRQSNRIYKTCDSCQQKFECKDASSAGSKCEDCLSRMLG